MDDGFGEIVGFGGCVEESAEDFWGVEDSVDVGADDGEGLAGCAVGAGL